MTEKLIQELEKIITQVDNLVQNLRNILDEQIEASKQEEPTAEKIRYTQNDLIIEATNFARQHGIPALKKILTEFNASSVKEIRESQYHQFMDKLK